MKFTFDSATKIVHLHAPATGAEVSKIMDAVAMACDCAAEEISIYGTPAAPVVINNYPERYDPFPLPWQRPYITYTGTPEITRIGTTTGDMLPTN